MGLGNSLKNFSQNFYITFEAIFLITGFYQKVFIARHPA